MFISAYSHIAAYRRQEFFQLRQARIILIIEKRTLVRRITFRRYGSIVSPACFSYHPTEHAIESVTETVTNCFVIFIQPIIARNNSFVNIIFLKNKHLGEDELLPVLNQLLISSIPPAAGTIKTINNCRNVRIGNRPIRTFYITITLFQAQFFVVFLLYPQSQYGPPDASVYSRTKFVAPPASLIV